MAIAVVVRECCVPAMRSDEQASELAVWLNLQRACAWRKSGPQGQSPAAPALTSVGISSRVSPGWVCVLRIVPAGSSSTECAVKQAESLHAPTVLLTFLTLFLRSR